LKRPSSLVLRLRFSPVFSLTSVTVAPTSTPPEESVTVPVMLPVMDCAATPWHSNRTAKRPHTNVGRRLRKVGIAVLLLLTAGLAPSRGMFERATNRPACRLAGA
jgi:hypothetical protein